MEITYLFNTARMVLIANKRRVNAIEITRLDTFCPLLDKKKKTYLQRQLSRLIERNPIFVHFIHLKVLIDLCNADH